MALDAAYNGDRCVLGHVDFGTDENGEMILCCYPHVIVPVIVRADMIAEDQIAIFCKQYAQENDCIPENFYHDSTGRGLLGNLARQNLVQSMQSG